MAYSVVRDFVVDEKDMRLHSSGIGRPLLLLHELAGSARSFTVLVPLLVAGGREAVALDLPGHGHSEGVPGSDLHGAAWAVAGALDEVCDDPVDVVGIDFGGYLALTVAAQFPTRIRRLVVVEPQAPPQAGHASAGIVPAKQRARGALNVLMSGRGALQRMHSTVGQLRAADPHWWNGLAAIQAPTLVVDGGGGRSGNGVDLDALADRINDSKRLSVGTSHRPWVTDAGQLADAVLAFVA